MTPGKAPAPNGTVFPAALALAPDLARRAPRGPRCRLGGYALLPRMPDKTRAHLAGTPGEYRFNRPLDRQFFDFAGVDAHAFRAALAEGRGDGEMLAWVNAHSARAREPWEIEAWSAYQDRRRPDGDPETAAFFVGLLAKVAKGRADIHSWVDLLDLDDHVSFGGPA